MAEDKLIFLWILILLSEKEMEMYRSFVNLILLFLVLNSLFANISSADPLSFYPLDETFYRINEIGSCTIQEVVPGGKPEYRRYFVTLENVSATKYSSEGKALESSSNLRFFFSDTALKDLENATFKC